MMHVNRRSLPGARGLPGGLLALSLVFLANCGGGTDPEDPSLSGEWAGQITLPGLQASIVFGLAEDDAGAVTGTMTWTQQGGPPLAGIVMGTHTNRNVLLNMEIALMAESLRGKYEARLATDDRMEGTFASDDGQITGSLNMERQGT